MIYIGFGQRDYLSRFDVDDETLFESDYYLEMAGMTLITRANDFDSYFGKIVDMSYSYWMPEEIKEKMEFLKITGYYKEVQPDEVKNYARLKTLRKENKDDEWLIITPNLKEFRTDDNQLIKIDEAVLTVNEYISSKNILIKAIIKWLDEKSHIKLDFKLYEPDQSIKK